MEEIIDENDRAINLKISVFSFEFKLVRFKIMNFLELKQIEFFKIPPLKYSNRLKDGSLGRPRLMEFELI